MSTILKRRKGKLKDTTKFECVTINFANINFGKIKYIAFVMFLFLGIIYSTTIYEKFNNLPPDRNEYTALKESSIILKENCLVEAKLKFQAITTYTVINFYNNSYVKIVDEHHKISNISAKSSDKKILEKNSVYFSKKLDIQGEFSAQFHLFDTPFGEKFIFSC